CPVPIVNMIEETIDALIEIHGIGQSIGLLATDGAIQNQVYQQFDKGKYNWIFPDTAGQEKVMKIIYEGIKAGRMEGAVEGLAELIQDLEARGAKAVILGCTELSLCFEQLQERNFDVVDPLRILAQRLVETALAHQRNASSKVNDRI